jgi:hypothetical protein
MVNGFFLSIYLILPAALFAGVYSASNKNQPESEKCLWGAKRRPAHKADGHVSSDSP